MFVKTNLSSVLKLLSAAMFLPLLLPLTADAAHVVTAVDFAPGWAIPDDSTVGVADIRTLESEIEQIESLEVTLTITGGFNGDYYVYLRHGDALCVLMNRVGVTAANDPGYGDSGVSVVTFSADAANGDIHRYQEVAPPGGGALTGTWRPDGRNAHPDFVLGNSPRTSLLEGFTGLPASGSWTLFVADMSPVGTGTLAAWSLTITGAVPEPGSSLLLGCAGALAWRRRRGRR